jgi:hypothetical protein
MEGDSYVVAIDGLAATRTLADLPAAARRNAARAINTAAQRAAAEGRRQIRAQVNFPAQYLTGSVNGQPRFGITERATGESMVSMITARWRPTSLARFATTSRVNKPGVGVEIHPGMITMLPKAFLIRLRAGMAGTDSKSNLGLAVRLKPGQTPDHTIRAVRMKSGLWLLYGPSVSQVFKSVREQVAPLAGEVAAAEFSRLLELNLQ